MAFGVLLIVIAAILAALFPQLINIIVNKQIALKDGGRTYGWWKAPPVIPRLHVYIYNVTNADEFLNNGEKPVLDELGPYVYSQHWEKVEIKFNENDTVSYKIRKQYVFTPVSRFIKISFLSSLLPFSSLSFFLCLFSHLRDFNVIQRSS